MMRSIIWQSVTLAGLALVALAAAAHHSPNIYDQQRSVTMQGVVTKYDWANPHVYVYIDVSSADGEPEIWELENGPTTMMKRRGWSSDSYAPGDHVIVHGNPARDRARKMILVTSIEREDRTLYSREGMAEALSVGAGPRARAPGLTGTWAVPLSANALFSAPSSWPLTEKGAEAVASYDDVTMNPQLQCMSRTAPWVMIFPGVHSIEVGGTIVSIRSEYDTVERSIHMDVATHEGAAATQQGHSIGRWDGDALVVDTTRFADHRNGNARGVPSGAEKHLVERFEVDADRRSLTYRFDLRDSEYLAEPITGEMQWAYRPDLDFAPVECELENAHRFVGD
jgi:hypothetical protein